MRKLTSFAAGLLFGMGLLLSGMTNPAKVIGFLDLAGAWDPSLALVMVGAIATAVLPFTWAKARTRSLLDAPMQLPAKRELDGRLIGAVCCSGWGGASPGSAGPSIAMLLGGHWQVVVFVFAMLAGMLLFSALERRRAC